MQSMTVLGARAHTRPALTPDRGQLAGTPFALFDAAVPARPAETVLFWRVSVEGFGRDGLGSGPWPVRTMEFETPLHANRADLRSIVERASVEDVANYRAGD